jgi:hypothetical protein
MRDVELTFKTNNTQVDQVLAGMVGILEMMFPERIRGYYLGGSYASGTAVATSDIDGEIMFKGDYEAGEHDRVWQILEHLADIMPYELDFGPVCERQIFHFGDSILKQETAVLFGEDVRGQIPLIPVDYIRWWQMPRAGYFLARIRGNPAFLIYPLTYPDEAMPIYGYESRPIRNPDGTEEPGMKELINVVGKPALARAMLKSDHHITSKEGCLQQYRLLINDEWMTLLDDVYRKVRDAWSYRIPQSVEAQDQLRQICVRTLAFENHFLREFRAFALQALQPTVEAGWWLPVDLRPYPLPPNLELPSRIDRGEKVVFIEHFHRIEIVKSLQQIRFMGDNALVAALRQWLGCGDVLLATAVADTLAVIS